MRWASIREFRSALAEFLEQTEPVIITRHGKPAAVLYPLKSGRNVPAEIRHDVADAVASEYGIDVPDAVVDTYKRDVDRTLIRENLRRTHEERLRALEAMQRLQNGLRTAAHRTH